MKRPNLYDRLKVVAIITMIVDHIGYSFFPEILWLRLVGRIAFPIFLFLVGFNGSYKWRWDLLWRALALQIPIFVLHFGFGFGGFALNILFGIIVGRVVLWLVESPLKRINRRGLLILGISIILLLVHPCLAQVMDYGSFVILFPMMGLLFRNENHEGLSFGTEGRIYPSLYSGGQFFNLLYGTFIFVALGFFSWQVFGFSPLQFVVLCGFFILLLCIFFLLGQANYFLPIIKKVDAIILFVSKNALLIYVFHLLILGGIKIFLMWR